MALSSTFLRTLLVASMAFALGLTLVADQDKLTLVADQDKWKGVIWEREKQDGIR